MVKSLKKTILALTREAGGTWGIAVEDLNDGIYWGENDHLQFIAESVIKIPVMAAVLAAVEKQELSLSQEIVLKREHFVGGSGVLQHLSPGVRLPVDDLLTLMIIQSDNTATNLLIDLIGIEAIQQIMVNVGMGESEINRKLVVYPPNAKNNLITAADVSLLLKSLATGTVVSQHSCEQMINLLKKQQIRNGLPAYLPADDGEFIGTTPAWELANKPGWDTGRQHDVGIFYAGKRIVTVSVLSKDVDPVVALDTLGKIGKEIYLYAQQ